MRKIFLLLYSLCLFKQNVYSQDPIVWYYNHNDEVPGAEYAFSFVHLSDIHIGEGDPDGDYGSFGFQDSLLPGETGTPAERLLSSITWINEHYIEKNIRFVVISGDITDSGEKSEFYKAKYILDGLEVPYVPLIGNHDVWPYIKGDSAREAPYPYGDSLLNEIFAGVFDTLSEFFDNWDNGTRLTRGWNAEGNTNTYLQNYVGSFAGNYFIFLDFDPRYHAVFPEGPGIGPEAQLHDYAEGTLHWLKQTLQTLPEKGNKNIFLFSHHPPAKDIWAFINAFSLDELVRITEVLQPFRQHLGIWFAGHIHRNEQYILNAAGQIPIVQCLEVESNKEQPYGALRVVNVYNAAINTGFQQTVVNDQLKLHPNPSDGDVWISYPQSLRGSGMVTVYATDGRIVYNEIITLGEDGLKLSLKSLGAGAFRVKISIKDVHYTLPLVID